MIPDSAIEAAHKAWREQAKQDGTIFEYNLRAAIEAAAAHIVRDAKADAWDEGIEAGVDVRTRKLDYARNPYRTAK